jgi:hypothetical protein
LVAAALAGAAVPVRAQDEGKVGRTPPRLSFVDGNVSFWRVGYENWEAARLNIAMAPGDLLYTGADSNFELQVAGRAFVRAGADTQLGLVSQEPDYLQLKVTAGTAAIDVRQIAPGHTIEVDTPNSALTIDRPGYYRVDVHQDTTAVSARRGGRAVLTPAGGRSSDIGAGEQVVIQGTATPQLATYQAPALDGWDRWNYGRTDQLLQASSDRYVPADMYGVADLDRYGGWRVVPTYGRVWVPAVATGWAPYSTGRWMWDPYYGWTWVDAAAWGWAPFHYGRWVHLDSYWAWAPGPIPVAFRPVYAPALVAFFGGSGVQVSVGIGGPFVSWVALGWGDPLVPWWGPVGFIGRPWWAGWSGPRHTHRDRWYHNVRVHDAVVGVPRGEFGHGARKMTRFGHIEQRHLAPLEVARFKPVRTRTAPPREQPRPVFTTREHPSKSARLGAERAAPPPQAGQVPRQPRSERLQTREQQRVAPPPQQAAPPVRAPGAEVRQPRSERVQTREQQRVAPPPRQAAPPVRAPNVEVRQPRSERLQQRREAAPAPLPRAVPPVQRAPANPPPQQRSYQPRSERLQQHHQAAPPRVQAPAPRAQSHSSRSERAQERH